MDISYGAFIYAGRSLTFQLKCQVSTNVYGQLLIAGHSRQNNLPTVNNISYYLGEKDLYFQVFTPLSSTTFYLTTSPLTTGMSYYIN